MLRTSVKLLSRSRFAHFVMSVRIAKLNCTELLFLSFQLKAFRMQQESRAGLGFLRADGKPEDLAHELVNIQASHAETVLELQKTRNLLLLEHRISKDLQVNAHTQ